MTNQVKRSHLHLWGIRNVSSLTQKGQTISNCSLTNLRSSIANLQLYPTGKQKHRKFCLTLCVSKQMKISYVGGKPLWFSNSSNQLYTSFKTNSVLSQQFTEYLCTVRITGRKFLTNTFSQFVSVSQHSKHFSYTQSSDVNKQQQHGQSFFRKIV